MQRRPLSPIVELGVVPGKFRYQKIGRRITETSSVCIEVDVDKNGTLSTLTDLTNRTFRTRGERNGTAHRQAHSCFTGTAADPALSRQAAKSRKSKLKHKIQ